MSSDFIFAQVNEYPWIAAFDVNGVDWPGLGGCAATLVRIVMPNNSKDRR